MPATRIDYPSKVSYQIKYHNQDGKQLLEGQTTITDKRGPQPVKGYLTFEDGVLTSMNLKFNSSYAPEQLAYDRASSLLTLTLIQSPGFMGLPDELQLKNVIEHPTDDQGRVHGLTYYPEIERGNLFFHGLQLARLEGAKLPLNPANYGLPYLPLDQEPDGLKLNSFCLWQTGFINYRKKGVRTGREVGRGFIVTTDYQEVKVGSDYYYLKDSCLDQIKQPVADGFYYHDQLIAKLEPSTLTVTYYWPREALQQVGSGLMEHTELTPQYQQVFQTLAKVDSSMLKYCSPLEYFLTLSKEEFQRLSSE